MECSRGYISFSILMSDHKSFIIINDNNLDTLVKIDQIINGSIVMNFSSFVIVYNYYL